MEIHLKGQGIGTGLTGSFRHGAAPKKGMMPSIPTSTQKGNWSCKMGMKSKTNTPKAHERAYMTKFVKLFVISPSLAHQSLIRMVKKYRLYLMGRMLETRSKHKRRYVKKKSRYMSMPRSAHDRSLITYKVNRVVSPLPSKRARLSRWKSNTNKNKSLAHNKGTGLQCPSPGRN